MGSQRGVPDGRAPNRKSEQVWLPLRTPGLRYLTGAIRMTWVRSPKQVAEWIGAKDADNRPLSRSALIDLRGEGAERYGENVCRFR